MVRCSGPNCTNQEVILETKSWPRRSHSLAGVAGARVASCVGSTSVASVGQGDLIVVPGTGLLRPDDRANRPGCGSADSAAAAFDHLGVRFVGTRMGFQREIVVPPALRRASRFQPFYWGLQTRRHNATALDAVQIDGSAALAVAE